MLCETILVKKNRIVKQICQDMKTGNSVIKICYINKDYFCLYTKTKR